MKTNTQLFKNAGLALFLLFFSLKGLAQISQNITYDNNGTFTVPVGVTSVTVDAWGGGGRGGTRTSNGNGGGGGGGAYARKVITVIPGNSYTVTVGAGSSSASAGGDSWFINNTTILAKGGNSVADNSTSGATGGLASLSIGDITRNGGNGANAGTDYGGGGGSSAGTDAAGVTADGSNGAIAISGVGNGANGRTGSQGNGSNASQHGGGGGGARRTSSGTRNGGNGGRGRVIITYSIASPGGISSKLQLWLRSDLLDGTTSVANNSDVTVWKTMAFGSDATKPSRPRAPKYRNNSTHNINFNAVVDFTNNYNSQSQVYTDNDTSREYLRGTSGFYNHDFYVVMMPDVPVDRNVNNMDIFCGERNNVQETDVTGIGIGDYSSRFTNEVLSYCIGTNARYGVAQVSTTTVYDNVGIINARNNSSNNGGNLFYNNTNVGNTTVNASTFENVSSSQYWIGRSKGWNGSLDGRVAEIITLDERATDEERNRIQSYLGIKYGITLGVNGTAQHYVNSDSNRIWNASANSGFNYDIAGIGRDDVSMLNQKQSKSVNSGTVLTIGLGDIATTNTANPNTFSTNKSYLVWGSNGQNMNNSGIPLAINLGPSIITTYTDIVNRKWKVVESGGDVAMVKISVPTSALGGLPALTATDSYVMIVADNASFTTNVETVFMSASGTNQVCLYDFDGTKFISFGVAHQTKQSLHITFDGINDCVKFDKVNNLGNTFSIMAWVNPNGNNALSTEKTIVSKRNDIEGYRLALQTDNKLKMEWTNGGTTYTAVSNTALPNGKWHHIAVTFSSTNLRFYIDGVQDALVTMAATPTATNSHFAIGGEYINKSSIINFFKGNIDELRIWNQSLSATQIRFIMNQEIEQFSTNNTSGKIIPNSVTKNDISTLMWNRLIAYYSMNSYIGTHLDDDSINRNRGNVVIPDKIALQNQTAPLPYVSNNNGNWTSTSTWLNGSIMDIPNTVSIIDETTPINWNIVRTQHNIDSEGNKTLLGLFVDSNRLSAKNDTKIEISHYLKLDGIIDLVGQSQLVQVLNSDLDPTSSGSLERDQKGQANKFNYNYWSSPVSSINNSTINHGYTVAGVMKDGTNPDNVQNILWTTGQNSTVSSPIRLSSYWIFKFQNLGNDYYNWVSVGQNGTLFAGQGYTLKGSNATASTQNYTFVGKPNNGEITSSVGANNLLLTGNPYPSALDANRFIQDNITSTTGVLQFWEHYSTNNTHNTSEYQGGYATRTLVGGTSPVAPALISGLGSSSRVPGRYIPVGQGFFVEGSVTGGTLKFDNNQRTFIRENNSQSNIMFRSAQTATNVTDIHYNNQEDFPDDEEQFMKLKLGYTAGTNKYYRQVLIGFMNEYADSGINPGYDALIMEEKSNDMYFLLNDKKINIMGEGYFDVNNVYPLGIKNAAAGQVTFSIDSKENFNEEQNIFIYDDETDSYHNINDNPFVIHLPAGNYKNRFSLRFVGVDSNVLDLDKNNIENAIVVLHNSKSNVITITNKLLETTTKSVALFNVVGQQIASWNTKNFDQANIELSISDVSTGTYIVKVMTDKGVLSKKILVK